MFTRLNSIQIAETEAIFLCIDWKVITDQQAEIAMIDIKKKSWEQYVYLEWLLLRWSVLRKDYKHLPAKLQLIV